MAIDSHAGQPVAPTFANVERTASQLAALGPGVLARKYGAGAIDRRHEERVLE
ncbi:MAG: hypothetical protein ACXVRI_09810 [Gaiellaceae bacterium]